jgi:hypothetical protein
VIRGALQHLALANSWLSIALTFASDANTRRPAPLDPPELPWAAGQACTAAKGAVRVIAHVAPFDDVAEAYQLVSINGWPVHNSIVHEYVRRIHKSLHAGRRQRPNKQLGTFAPAYILRLNVPDGEVFFAGTVLHRTAMLQMSSDLQAVLARVLLGAWHRDMPAVVLASVEQAAASGTDALGAALSGDASDMPKPASVPAVASSPQHKTEGLTSNRQFALQRAPRRRRLLQQATAALQPPSRGATYDAHHQVCSGRLARLCCFVTSLPCMLCCSPFCLLHTTARRPSKGQVRQ